jgi:hypothetical protein
MDRNRAVFVGALPLLIWGNGQWLVPQEPGR